MSKNKQVKVAVELYSKVLNFAVGLGLDPIEAADYAGGAVKGSLQGASKDDPFDDSERIFRAAKATMKVSIETQRDVLNGKMSPELGLKKLQKIINAAQHNILLT